MSQSNLPRFVDKEDRPAKEVEEEGTLDGWFEKLTEASALALGNVSLTAAMARLARNLGFDRYVYLTLQGAGSLPYPGNRQKWQHREDEQSYFSIDPVMSLAKHRSAIFAWDLSTRGKRLSKEVCAFIDEPAEFDFGGGISIPVLSDVGQMTIVSVARAAPTARDGINPAFTGATDAEAHARSALHRAAMTRPKEIRLKPAEILCLRWAAEGKSMKMISQIEDITFRDVELSIENTKSSLGTASLSQAIATAKVLGLI